MRLGPEGDKSFGHMPLGASRESGLVYKSILGGCKSIARIYG